jgi:hypothetical protein
MVGENNDAQALARFQLEAQAASEDEVGAEGNFQMH